VKKFGLILVVLVMLLVACDADVQEAPVEIVEPTVVQTEREMAWMACLMFGEKQRGVLSINAEEYQTSKVNYDGDSYAIEIFYPYKNQTLYCLVTKTVDGWGLFYMELE